MTSTHCSIWEEIVFSSSAIKFGIEQLKRKSGNSFFYQASTEYVFL